MWNPLIIKKSWWVMGLVPMLGIIPQVNAVEPSQLWLPRSEYRHFKTLYRAAEVAEQTQRCRYVIAGSLNRQRSTEDNPVFTITCRDENRETFAWIVEGPSLTILNMPEEPEVVPKDPQVVAQERARARLTSQWQPCYQQLTQRTAALRQIEGISGELPEEVAQWEQRVEFSVVFSARSLQGDHLDFRAHCEVVDDHHQLAIYPAKEIPALPVPVDPEEELGNR